MKLKEIDYQLLTELYHNHNEPLSKIAKKTKISRDKIEYRLNKYKETGIIRGFYPILNYKALGYEKQITIFLKFETNKQAKEFAKTLHKNKHCISYGELLEQYDLFINLIFKNEEEINTFLEQTLEEYKIEQHLIINPYFAELYPLKFLENKNKENYQLQESPRNKTKLDELDYKILKILSKNGRTKLLDIAVKTKQNSTTILYRLKKLKENKILLGNRIEFNTTILGYQYTILLLNIKQFNKELKEKLKRHVRASKNTNSLILQLQEPNAIIQYLYKEEQELRNEIKKLRKTFEEENITIETIHLEEGDHINITPFIE